jgi:hypothetical protein
MTNLTNDEFVAEMNKARAMENRGDFRPALEVVIDALEKMIVGTFTPAVTLAPSVPQNPQINPSTGLPYQDPQINPATGLPYQYPQNTPVAPVTGVPYGLPNPPVDPVTGVPYVRQQTIDPVTGVPYVRQ